MAEDKHTDTKKSQPIFRELNADDPEPEATVIESLCVNCGKNVSIRLEEYNLL